MTAYSVRGSDREGTAHPPLFNVMPTSQWLAERNVKRPWWRWRAK